MDCFYVFCYFLPMTKAVFIDMDDTLIDTMELYAEAMAQLAAYLGLFGVAHEEALKTGWKINDALYAEYGYSPLRFPMAFEQTLRHFVPNANAGMIATARSFAEGVFQTAAVVKQGVIESIDLLIAQYPVYLVTQGDQTVQEKRINDLPFKDKLAEIFIVSLKSKETFESLTAHLGYAPGDVVMIGDSLKSDIQTAAAAGLQAFWVEGYNWHAIENNAVLPEKNAKKFSSFAEAAQHVLSPAAPPPKPENKKPRLRLP